MQNCWRKQSYKEVVAVGFKSGGANVPGCVCVCVSVCETARGNQGRRSFCTEQQSVAECFTLMDVPHSAPVCDALQYCGTGGASRVGGVMTVWEVVGTLAINTC